MSNFYSWTLNPKTKQLQYALWQDDAFGAHKYGVLFPGETELLPATEVPLPKFVYEVYLADPRDGKPLTTTSRLVWAPSEEEARRLYRLNSEHELDYGTYELEVEVEPRLELENAKHEELLAQLEPWDPGVTTNPAVYRLAGYCLPDERECTNCGLAPYGMDEHAICAFCERCPACSAEGGEENCPCNTH